MSEYHLSPSQDTEIHPLDMKLKADMNFTSRMVFFKTVENDWFKLVKFLKCYWDGQSERDVLRVPIFAWHFSFIHNYKV